MPVHWITLLIGYVLGSIITACAIGYLVHMRNERMEYDAVLLEMGIKDVYDN